MSWSVFAGEIPTQTVLAMPPALAKATANFLRALAIEAGSACDLGRPAPGDPLDDTGLRHSLEIPGEPVIIEYLIVPEQQQIRVPVLVWMN
ncbi:hypothetical protein [Streptomyces sp. TS71-3]|uniref:hypothetical protein n=1 Tax=Streptomyces sp. TS71-3 TaxID=2733862 RepID=UPI001B08EA03|nr:hypothetical protein [Streptomyces sp. TS71-3]GHJ39240.1 hypothetical protein Sm713_48490 [Streptomyces sp. TS71-3]